MNDNFTPILVQPVLETPCLSVPEINDATPDPLLDETGHPIQDEEGRSIHGF